LASLGELAAGIAHEINNPNALILYNSDILNTMIMDLFRFLEENPPADSGQLFGGLSYQDVAREVPVLLPMIQDSAQRIKRIVNDLRDFSRQDSSAAEDIVDVNQAVQASVRLVHNAIKKATDHFAMDLAAALPVVIGAAGRLDQVIINLLMNACQALENRAQAVSISTAYDTETGQVQVIVADEGHGMTEDVLDHILEPFVTTKREQGGTGLGLSVSSRIIRELQGTLSFTSAPGEGTTATISLPVRKEVNHDG
jgi:signal transduction histidine kinase